MGWSLKQYFAEVRITTPAEIVMRLSAAHDKPSDESEYWGAFLALGTDLKAEVLPLGKLAVSFTAAKA